MAKQYAMYSGSEHLREHPHISADGCLINPGDRHVHYHSRHLMTALPRTTLSQAPHVLRQAPHVERSVLHVVADIVSKRLGVFYALVEGANRARVGAGIVNRLALLQKLNGSIDVFRLGPVREGGRGEEDQRQRQ